MTPSGPTSLAGRARVPRVDECGDRWTESCVSLRPDEPEQGRASGLESVVLGRALLGFIVCVALCVPTAHQADKPRLSGNSVSLLQNQEARQSSEASGRVRGPCGASLGLFPIALGCQDFVPGLSS